MTLLDTSRVIVGEMVEFLPLPPRICHACGDPYFAGCELEHKHSGWTCYDSYDDTRACRVCGGTIHKYCDKDGESFWYHRQVGDIE